MVTEQNTYKSGVDCAEVGLQDYAWRFSRSLECDMDTETIAIEE